MPQERDGNNLSPAGYPRDNDLSGTQQALAPAEISPCHASAASVRPFSTTASARSWSLGLYSGPEPAG